MIQPTLLLALLLAAPPAGPAPAPAPAAAAVEALPTSQDVRKLIDEGKPADALKPLARLLALRGRAAQPYDRCELLTLKAEAHLRLRANDAAAAAFRQASEATGDREQQAIARATEQLIRRSRGLAFTPKHAPKGRAANLGPIDVIDPEKRRAALRAMFADDMADVAPKVQAAKEAKTLPPRLKAIQAARDVAYLELAANGSADQVNGIVDELKEGAKALLARATEKATKRVDQITAMANDTELVRRVLPGIGGYAEVDTVEKRRGLRRQDATDLKQLADTCDEVTAGAKALAQATGADETEFEEITEAAEDLRMHIRRMLRAHDVDY